MTQERLWHLGSYVAGIVVIVLGSSTNLSTQEWEAPNVERSSSDTLFEQSDLGNVVERARLSYGAGMRELKRAEKLAAKATGLSGKKGDSAEASIDSVYAKAGSLFEEALGFDPTLVEAYAGLAKAYRNSGRTAESLLVISRGLHTSPEDTALLAEWSQSLSALDMAEDAPRVYVSLVQSDVVRAATLMVAMKDWVADQSAQPERLDPEGVERLAAWIAAQGTG